MTPSYSELEVRLRTALAPTTPPDELPDAVHSATYRTATERTAPLRTTTARRYRLVRDLAPELSYGRHAGPAPYDARPAAVLLLLYPMDGHWHVPLTLRPTHLPTHAGQISLPGGAIEPGESAEQCATREWAEELGEPGFPIEILGRLPALYVFASNYLVTPCVAIAPQVPPFQANLREVAEVFPLPLRDLWDASRLGEHVEQRGRMTFRAPHIICHGYRIWGATALILGELLEVIGEGWEENE